MYSLGLDLGSTTAKYALLDAEGRMVGSEYRRHGAAVRETAAALLEKILESHPTDVFRLTMTGSAALDVSLGIGAGFVQEVISTSTALRRFAPETDVAIELGGEDAKILYLTDGMELRMNEVCAGGTGAFIDQMAALLNTDASGLNSLAAGATITYPIASRCGVFAKTDVVPLLNAGAKREDIAVSILQAVVDQTIGGLACGRPIRGHVAFLGGPLHFLTELKKCFIKTLKLAPEFVVDCEQGQYVVAEGAALTGLEPNRTKEQSSEELPLAEWLRRLRAYQPTARGSNMLQPLFKDEAEYEAFKAAHNSRRTPTSELASAKGDLWMGLDLGSTTVKAVVLDSDNRIAASWYGTNSGDVLKTLVPKVVELLHGIPEGARIRGICTTGYGAELAAAVLGTPLFEVETIAHLKAASFLDPEATYVIDIGGQDMKCLKTHHGIIEQVKLNEACSSGCGAFIQTFARSLGLTLDQFVKKALFARHPADLGTRCTVFMNSRVKQAQKEGADIGDIAAGLCYSVIRNALYKVLRLRSVEELGDHVVVQGGSFINDALLRVLELLLGRTVLRPDIAGLMGAFGCALIAREKTERNSLPAPTLSAEALETLDVITRSFHCKGCNNRCLLTMNRFSNGRKFISGNRCDFGAKGGAGKKRDVGNNIYAWKLAHLFQGEPLPEDKAPRGVIGIPRALNIYEHYPYWFTLFTKLGFRVVLSPESSKSIFDSGLTSMPSQSVCFPAKLAHGHINWLASHGVTRIWFPCVPRERKEFKESDNTFACPVVAGYPEVARLNADFPEGKKPVILTPFVLLSDGKVVARVIRENFPEIPEREIAAAVKAAEKAMESWQHQLQCEGEHMLSEAQAKGRVVILIAGRPYHADPYINHGLPDYIASLGVTVLSEDSIAHLAPEPDKLRVINQWAFHARMYRVATLAAQEPGVELVQLTNFGCGIDAITSDQIAQILAKAGKLHTLLKIDEGDSLGPAKIRIASLLAAVAEKKEAEDKGIEPAPEEKSGPDWTPPVFLRSMRKTRTILAPQMSPIHFPIIEAALLGSGYRVKLLPTVSMAAIETGLTLVNNDACYPAIVSIGQLVHAIKSGKYDPDNTALMLAQTCGPCRATNYIALLQRALAEEGFKNTPIVSLSGGNFNEQPGFSLSPLAMRRMVLGLLLGDMLQRLYFATRSHELCPGDADEMLAKWTRRSREIAFHNNFTDFRPAMINMVREFASVPTDDIVKPRVGIVGEILLKYHPDANRHLTDTIMKEGGEPVLTDMADFFLYCLSDNVLQHRFLNGPFIKAITSRFFLNRLDSARNAMREALRGTPYFPVSDFQRLQQSVHGLVSLGEQAGEGWLLTAEMLEFITNGVTNVLCLQPFGCLPNHVTGKGVIKAIREKHPESNLMAIDFEAGNSEANVSNRVKLFMSVAREQMAGRPVQPLPEPDPEEQPVRVFSFKGS
ncbi:acyl-CoA dehydratase activase-related protein [Mesosutterella sp. OilRF-GAM-744-9]|uniref:Acyl-CoA dehydratase activase-related protein n=1 Tax=Mesosutterella porci TaxID=2915351 RepID=A0ABS9MQD9_9BURK|nr:acyl-CoA dehydratase activase-related protein [Mesosutterella sp. oilRF-744-WT-GAM-9]MCG5030835.1 acyl-CoA dehydratase activase-related protein [Mesosutterella sp. oilRF-744-WT-GAM-9]